jgi:hypothetical protein
MTRKNANAATSHRGARQKVSLNRNVPANTDAAQLLPTDQIRVGKRHDRPAFVYDGPDLYARVVLQADGWHAVLEATHTDLGTFPTREGAILFCNARKARAPAAPIAGERTADATHVKRIRIRQRQAREQRARRAGYAEISKPSPSPACRGRTRAADQPLSGDRRRASTPGVWSTQRPPRIK